MHIIKSTRAKMAAADPAEVARLEELTKNFTPLKPNTVVSALVTQVIEEGESDGWVCLSTTGKFESWIPRQEFDLQGHGVTPKPGDKVQIYYVNDHVASFAVGAQTRAWPSLERSYKEQNPVSGVILGRSKKRSGFNVALLPFGAKAILPLSKANIPLIKAKGEKAVLMFTIVKMDSKTLHITLSMLGEEVSKEA